MRHIISKYNREGKDTFSKRSTTLLGVQTIPVCDGGLYVHICDYLHTTGGIFKSDTVKHSFVR